LDPKGKTAMVGSALTIKKINAWKIFQRDMEQIKYP
jgi:hypothetical protein